MAHPLYSSEFSLLLHLFSFLLCCCRLIFVYILAHFCCTIHIFKNKKKTEDNFHMYCQASLFDYKFFQNFSWIETAAMFLSHKINCWSHIFVVYILKLFLLCKNVCFTKIRNEFRYSNQSMAALLLCSLSMFVFRNNTISM